MILQQGCLVEKYWSQIVVGDIVFMKSDEQVPVRLIYYALYFATHCLLYWFAEYNLDLYYTLFNNQFLGQPGKPVPETLHSGFYRS